MPERSRAGSPVQIARVEDQRLVIRHEVLEQVLRKAGSHPVAIVSINGPLRTGKSYMLGHFLRYLRGESGSPSEFPWRNSPDGHTTGIYLWSEPLLVEREPSSGGQVAVLLLDTEGCFDSKASVGDNALIFAFSCLLSSVLIFNVSKQLTEDVLEFLQVFAASARQLSGLGPSDRFSKLVFLVRDWQFIKDYPCRYYDRVPLTSNRNFLHDKLLVKSTMTRDARTLHDDILSSFDDVACCLLPHPGVDLACYDRPYNLRPEFAQAVDAFLPRILHPDSLVTKKGDGGRECTGRQLIPMVRDWSRRFAEMEMPPAEFNVTLFPRRLVYPEEGDTVDRRPAGDARQVALSGYCHRMEQLDFVNGIPPEKLQEEHGRALVEATAVFDGAQSSEGGDGRLYDDLCKSIEKQYQMYVSLNENTLQEEARRKRTWTKHERGGGYCRSCRGFGSTATIDDALDSRLDTLRTDVVRQVVDTLRKEHANDKHRIERLRKEVSLLKEELPRSPPTAERTGGHDKTTAEVQPMEPATIAVIPAKKRNKKAKKNGFGKKRQPAANTKSGTKNKKGKYGCQIM